jgi:hypothetical protein
VKTCMFCDGTIFAPHTSNLTSVSCSSPAHFHAERTRVFRIMPRCPASHILSQVQRRLSEYCVARLGTEMQSNPWNVLGTSLVFREILSWIPSTTSHFLRVPPSGGRSWSAVNVKFRCRKVEPTASALWLSPRDHWQWWWLGRQGAW